MQPLTHAKYASRSLKRGEVYVPPPATVDPRELSRAGLDELLDASDSDLIRTLAARVNLGRIYGNAVCAAAGLDLKLAAAELADGQRKTLSDSMARLLSELLQGTGAYIWFSDSEGLSAWHEAGDNPLALDSASAGIDEFSPILLPFKDEELAVGIDSLCATFDAVFGAHDAIAYIRREEEKLVAAGTDEAEQSAKLTRRADQQRSAIERFETQAALTQELAKSVQDNWTHVDDLLSQVNGFIESDSWQSLEAKSGEIIWIDGDDAAKSRPDGLIVLEGRGGGFHGVA